MKLLKGFARSDYPALACGMNGDTYTKGGVGRLQGSIFQ